MQIKDFNLQGTDKISKINAVLKEEFGMSISAGFPKKEKLETIKEMSEMAIIKLKDTSKHFQLEPEYAKFLGVKDVIDTMLAEGQYAESPAYEGMKEDIFGEGKAEGGLMDLGGREMDLRGGGFVPIGKKEKADDVPARLSKNEFVMTADAVRAAGGGSVNEGAKRMYETMNKLEARA